jgi:ABC-2 type transport system ATP-binding protein
MNVIEIRKLTKYYGKDRGILDLDLEIQEGEIFGFIGPNGAGKSTTIRTLLGLIFPTSGSGTILGKDIVRESREIKRHIGFMPSDVNYYEKMDVAELLRYSGGFYGVDCSARTAELADTFALDLDRKILDLSQGNKKKVSILQCLIHRPRLLILDEPTSGLDPLMQNKFFDILRQENRDGTTVFFSSHTLSEVQKMCRRVGIIKEGRIIAVEDIETLRRKQLRKVEVEFASAELRDRFAIDGMISPRKHNHALNFMYAGRIEELIRVLPGQEVTDLLIEEPTLEEIFMHYYDDDDEDPDSGKGGPER